MSTDYQQSVVEYFADKADEYDRVDEQAYWRLSDELLWTSLERFVLPELPAAPRILDSGGGTGRWTDRLLTAIPDATGVLFDLSPDMTRVARDKSERHGYADRLEIIVGDLAELGSRVEPSSFDLAINFHNVLGFVADPAAVIGDLVAALRPGGVLTLFVPSLHHGVFFNVGIGALDVAEQLVATGRGSFTSTMPDMHFFTGPGLRSVITEAGATPAVVSGTPVFTYPGYAETQIEGNSDRLHDLQSADTFARVLELERSVLGDESLVARGNNLFVTAVRR